MDPTLAVLVTVASLIILLAMQCPVAFALIVSGAFGLILIQGTEYTQNVLGGAPFDQISNYSLTIVPMFILIGIFAVQGKLAEQVYEISSYAFRRVPGALGCATVAACAGFAAVSGSSVATAATMAKLSINEMRRRGYPGSFAAGVVASAGTLGVLIPPSIILVFYSILTRESTAELLAAGILPGILTAVVFMTYIILWMGPRIDQVELSRAAEALVLDHRAARPMIHSSVGSGSSPIPGSPEAVDNGHTHAEVEDQRPSGLSNLPWRGVVRIAILFMIILGGVYSGFFTATESGAIGALAALLFMLFELRRDKAASLWRNFRDALSETAQVTSMVFAVVVGSAVFSAFLLRSGTPQAISKFAAEAAVPPTVIIILFVLFLLPLGMALESLSIMIIAVPLMYPVVIDLGFDGVWFGIIVTVAIEIGLITPPVGLSAFVVAGAVPEVSLEEVFKGVLPFVLLELVVIAILFVFPQIVLWLPSMVAQ